MIYAPKILDNLLSRDTKKRILEALKTAGKVEDSVIESSVQLVLDTFGGTKKAAEDLVKEGFKHYAWVVKVPERNKPEELDGLKKKKKAKLTVEDRYNEFLKTFPKTESFLKAIFKLKGEEDFIASLKKGNVKEEIIKAIMFGFSDTNLTYEEAEKLVEESEKGYILDPISEINSVEAINYRFESMLIREQIMIDALKLRIIGGIIETDPAKEKLAQEHLEILVKML